MDIVYEMVCFGMAGLYHSGRSVCQVICYHNLAMAITVEFTRSDLVLMPDDGERREIVDGELFVSFAVSPPG